VTLTKYPAGQWTGGSGINQKISLPQTSGLLNFVRPVATFSSLFWKPGRAAFQQWAGVKIEILIFGKLNAYPQRGSTK